MSSEHHERPVRRVNPSGAVRWIARYTGPDGKRRSAGTFKLQRQAQKAIDQAYKQREPSDTVGAYAARWLEEHPVSERTTTTNRSKIRGQLDVEIEGRPLKAWPLRELRRRHVRDLVHTMLADQGRAPGGVRDILRVFHRLGEDAITDELADVNPWSGVTVRDDDRRATKRARPKRVWSFEEMHEFAAHGRYRPRARSGQPDRPSVASAQAMASIRLLADCGLRVGELLALPRGAQRLADGLGRVVGTAWEGRVIASSDEKNHDRDFPIPAGALESLRAMPPRIDSPWLFPAPQGGLWRDSNWRRQVWAPTCEAAGMWPTPHEFRHSWTSHLRAAGIDPADLAEVAGHTVETATRVYTHPVRRSYDQIREVIG